MCPLGHLLACSWRSLSPCDATAAVALSLYSASRALAFGCHRSYSLAYALRLCFETRLVLSRRSAFVSAGAVFSCFFCSGLVSSLLSTLLPSQLFFSLISASARPLARRLRLLHLLLPKMSIHYSYHH